MACRARTALVVVLAFCAPAFAGQQGAPAGPATDEFKLRVDVNLILIEATVRDERGRLANALRREDFRIFEDDVEQEILHFSRDELPLAVALVVDRSGSVAPYFPQIRHAARETLKLLKPGDLVTLFGFATEVERIEPLTADRERVAESIASLQPGGGTNITDALFEAALYLSDAARRRRHAVILISDNQATARGAADRNDVIRLAMETETVIYSIQIGSGGGRGAYRLPDWVAGAGAVNTITRETGGEIFDTSAHSLTPTLRAVIDRLKQRYTLGYQSTNKARDGRFRAVEVRVRGEALPPGRRYQVHARRGYYAPSESAARERLQFRSIFPPSGPPLD
jgi:Ca-activated chloride channel family protein